MSTLLARFLIILSIFCITFIAIQNTINSILDEDLIELSEIYENENEEESEIKAWEELDFIHDQLSRLATLNELISTIYNPYYNINSYNSPIQMVITPPPNSNI